MSLLRDYQFRELTSFGGPWLLPDPSMVTTQGALLARNVEYSAGQVGTRLGFKAITFSSTTFASSGMYAWYAPMYGNYGSAYSDVNLVTLKEGAFGDKLHIYNVKSTTEIGSFDAPGVALGGMSCVGVGLRLYVVFFDNNQQGAETAWVGYGSSTAAPNIIKADILFPGPSGIVPTVSEPGAGLVTAGVHRYGYLLEFPGGFTTRASPDNGGAAPPNLTTFTPVSHTAAGSKNIRLTLDFSTGTPFSDYGAPPVYVSVIMTTTANLNQYYIVPGSRTAYGTSATYAITLSVSDGDLSSQGVDATPYLYWMTRTVWAPVATPGGLVFSVSYICLFGDRMAYKATQTDGNGKRVQCLYISERNNYQAITADQHLMMLPGQRNITTMFRMGGNNYIVGPHEIYSVTDTGDVPVTWPAPHLVDGRTGTLAIRGVEVAPSGQYAWIADQAGLFLFDGSPITALPVSYYQSSDWGRINWDAAYVVQIKDDAGKKRVHLLVPLDGAITPTHIMTFDYTDGASYLAVRYSLDNLSGYDIGAIELVRNDLPGQATGNQKQVELWLGPRTGTTYLRRASALDTNPYRDNAAAINSVYRTCPLPGRDRGQGLVQMHNGFHARIRGSGTITPILYDIDAQRSFTCRTLTMSTTPDADQLFHTDLRGELAFIEMATNTLDAYWRLAYLKYYYSPYIIQR